MPSDRHTSERSSRMLFIIYMRKFLNGLYQTIDTKKGLKSLPFSCFYIFKAEFISVLLASFYLVYNRI